MSETVPPRLELIVYGASGRMGQSVIEVAKNDSDFKKIIPIKRFSDFKKQGDVVVDFSLPAALSELVQYCDLSKTPLVSGTTGLSSSQMGELKNLARRIPVLWSPNMSLGVLLLQKLLKEFRFLSDWNFDLEETHHIHKKDKPSGTALRLKEVLEEATGKSHLSIQSIRRDEVIGDHVVRARGPFEEIYIEHKATDRRVFAQGAIRAAKWLYDQPPGFYSLYDILNGA